MDLVRETFAVFTVLFCFVFSNKRMNLLIITGYRKGGIPKAVEHPEGQIDLPRVCTFLSSGTFLKSQALLSLCNAFIREGAM